VMVWEGENIIAAMRTMMGATNPQNAAVGTIRGDYAQQTGRNLIHGSDGPESARREIELFFNDYELQNWNRSLDPWYLE
jgi:nucleoside-diphosphate kinase